MSIHRSAVIASLLVALGACSKPAEKSEAAAGATATQAEWGALSDGTKVQAVELKNSKGVTARVISYGATLQDLIVPDKDGKGADIVIGYDNIEGYEKTPNYTGVTVGRYANRIAKGKFTIDGKTYTLATNNGANALHGGTLRRAGRTVGSDGGARRRHAGAAASSAGVGHRPLRRQAYPRNSRRGALPRSPVPLSGPRQCRRSCWAAVCGHRIEQLGP